MRTLLEFDKPDELDATMKITMKVRQWRELRDQLTESWPACDLRENIIQLLRKVDQTFYSIAEDN